MKTLVGSPKRVKKRPFVYEVQHSRCLRNFPFRQVINKHVKVVQRFLDRECKSIVARTVAPKLFRSMYSVAWPHGRRTRQGWMSVFCFLFVSLVTRICCALHSIHQLSTASVQSLFALEEVKFNERVEKKNSQLRRCASPSSFSSSKIHVSLISHKLYSWYTEVIWFLVSALLVYEYDTNRLIDRYSIFIRRRSGNIHIYIFLYWLSSSLIDWRRLFEELNEMTSS